MPTIKKRLNITLPEGMDIVLEQLARRDNVPQATKAAELLQRAIELEEDEMWDRAASLRDKKGAAYVAHHKAWGKNS